MGGYGSGNWYRWDSKLTTESLHRIDIRWLKKKGCLWSGKFGFLSWSCCNQESGYIIFRMKADRMVLNYRYRPHSGEWEKVEQTISFDRTPCNYGGHRTWFLCPRCLKRVAVLYGAGKYFFCRHCYSLTYSSQQLSRADRLMRSAEKIRERMGGSAGLLEPFPDKPKKMQWKTYWRLYHRAEHATTLSTLIMEQRLGIQF